MTVETEVEVVTPDVDLEPEVSGTEGEQEELDYEAEFDAAYGDSEPEPTPEVEPEPEVIEGTAEEQVGEEQQSSDSDPEPVSEPDPDDPYAWIEGLSDEVKAQAEALKHAAESDKGRVSAYNRRLSALQYEVDRMKSRPDLTAEQTDKGDLNESAAAPELPEEYKQLKEDFPEFADAVDAIRKHDRSEFDKMVADRLQPIEDERTTQARKNFDSEVSNGAEEIFDTTNTGVDWHDVVTSNNFTSWLTQQPPSVQRAAAVRDSGEALNVLRRYEDDYQRSVQAKTDVETKQTQEEQTTKADNIKKTRTQRQAAGVAPGSKPSPSAGNSEGGGDYEAEFNARWG